MPTKTLQEYQAEILQLTASMNLPGVPDQEREIYRKTIEKIQGKIRQLQLQQQRAPNKSAQRSDPTPPESNPIPIRVIKPGLTNATRHTAEPPADSPTITAILTGGTKQVIIQWGHGRSDTLTEGEARSRFTTALRDLSQSRMARLERLADLRNYISYSRAVAYYRALIQFWTHPPTPAQLSIAPLSRLRQQIFDMILQTAQTHSNNTSAQ